LHNCSVTLIYAIFVEKHSFAKCYTASWTYKTGFFSSFMYWHTLHLLETKPLFFRLVEWEPFYVFRVYPTDVQLDPTSAEVCVSVLLMLRLVIHPALSFSSSSPSGSIIFPNTVKYQVLGSIAIVLLNFICGIFFWTVWDCLGQPCVAKGAQIS